MREGGCGMEKMLREEEGEGGGRGNERGREGGRKCGSE